jgi:hypothetical protein
MNMTSILSKALVLIVPVVMLIGAPTEARAQIVVTISPPAAYIATSQPEYFEGRPVYWYNNSWYYRDHGRWQYYRREPVFLHERRAHWAPARRRERVEDHRDRRRDDHRGDQRDGRYHYRH